MRRLFVDSFYYIALINPRDQHHGHVQTIAPTLTGCHFWTTDLVLIEVANALSAERLRGYAAGYVRSLEQSSDTTIIRLDNDLFERALSLYEQRSDKTWSLTDCLSFVVMEDHNLTEALTGDHHFRQAGFSPVVPGGATP